MVPWLQASSWPPSTLRYISVRTLPIFMWEGGGGTAKCSAVKVINSWWSCIWVPLRHYVNGHLHKHTHMCTHAYSQNTWGRRNGTYARGKIFHPTKHYKRNRAEPMFCTSQLWLWFSICFPPRACSAYDMPSPREQLTKQTLERLTSGEGLADCSKLLARCRSQSCPVLSDNYQECQSQQKQQQR